MQKPFSYSHWELFKSCLLQTKWLEKSGWIPRYSVLGAWKCYRGYPSTYPATRTCPENGILPLGRDRCWYLEEYFHRQISNLGPVLNVNCRSVSTKVGQKVLTAPDVLISSSKYLMHAIALNFLCWRSKMQQLYMTGSKSQALQERWNLICRDWE